MQYRCASTRSHGFVYARYALSTKYKTRNIEFTFYSRSNRWVTRTLRAAANKKETCEVVKLALVLITTPTNLYVYITALLMHTVCHTHT